jgi:hypothetical protein
MPEICRFLGLLIKIQYRDHCPPHIHVWYGRRDRATIDISDVSVMRGKLPRPQLTCVLAWVYLHQQELLLDWDRAARGERPERIAPLE